MGSETRLGGDRRAFEPTLWTVVLRAKEGSRDALGSLISLYWKPVYFFLRRRGLDVDASKETTQGFFAHLLERDFLKSVVREKGKFRSFLLKALENYRIDDARKRSARKRGGPTLDFDGAEKDLAAQSPGADSFDRQWALAVVTRAMDALRDELGAATFETLKPHLAGGPAYQDTAAKLGISVTAVTNLIHRTRRRYRELVERELSPSVTDEASLREELADLFIFLKG
jgi:RNA polymerase sigma-70 factor (ECF subfamily)